MFNTPLSVSQADEPDAEAAVARAVQLRLLKVLSSSGTQLSSAGEGRRRSSTADSSSYTFHHLTIFSAVREPFLPSAPPPF